jgi:hypothetical protein
MVNGKFKGEIYRGTALYPGETVQDLVKRLETGSSSLKSWSFAPGIAEEFAFGALAKTAKPEPFGLKLE